MADEQVPESRVYRHLICGEETVVSGSPFEVITNPLAAMHRTWCGNYNAFFPMDQYAWSDTGEKITDYWARHGARATQLERWLCSKTAMVLLVGIGLVAGLIVGYVLFRQKTTGTMIFMMAFMTSPRSFFVLAPDSAIACMTIFFVSSGESALGKNS